MRPAAAIAVLACGAIAAAACSDDGSMGGDVGAAGAYDGGDAARGDERPVVVGDDAGEDASRSDAGGGARDAAASDAAEGGARDAALDGGGDGSDDAGDAGDGAIADAAACDAGCTTPPSATCAGGDVVTYGAGACAGGACVYAPSTQPCDYGCFAAQCAAAPFSFLGGADAFVDGTTELALGLTSGGAVPTVAPTSTVTVVAQIAPPGTVREVHLFLDTDPTFSYRVDVPMTFDEVVGDRAQYAVVLPAQKSGTQVYFYIQAVPFSGGSTYTPAGGVKLTYRSQSQ